MKIEFFKNIAKKMRKANKETPLMRHQQQLARALGFACWADLTKLDEATLQTVIDKYAAFPAGESEVKP